MAYPVLLSGTLIGAILGIVLLLVARWQTKKWSRYVTHKRNRIMQEFHDAENAATFEKQLGHITAIQCHAAIVEAGDKATAEMNSLAKVYPWPFGPWR